MKGDDMGNNNPESRESSVPVPSGGEQHKDIISPQYVNIVEVEAEKGIPQEVINHLEAMSVGVTDESSICVDGGYKPEEAMGELARAGADAGLSMGLMALGFTPEDAVNAVYEFRLSRGQRYGWHTDTHESHTIEHGGMCGCGHANASFVDSHHYRLDGDDVAKMWSLVQTLEPAHTRFVNLDRDHQEQGILVVNSDEVTVLPRFTDDDGERQFFIYDVKRDQKLMKDLVEWLADNGRYKHYIEAQGGEDEFLNKFKQVIEYHTNVTLALLGSSKGKPMYQVEYEPVDGGYKAVISRIGNAPSGIDEVQKPEFLS